MNLPGYDEWKLREPEAPYDDDEPRCTCTTYRRDKYCTIHQPDPDDARDAMLESQWDAKEWI